MALSVIVLGVFGLVALVALVAAVYFIMREREE